MKIRRSLSLALLSLAALLSLTLAASAQQDDNTIKVDPNAAGHYKTLAAGVQPARLQATVRALSGIHYPLPAMPGVAPTLAYSRLAGTPGGDQARDYVKAQMQAILGNVTEETFNVTVPVDSGASITANGKSYALRPLWPNLVRTSTLPTAGVTGPLIYAGRGDLRAFRGKTVEGSVVLLDFNCGTQWLNAARLGARAILFVEPTQTMRGEAEAKFIGIPVNIPRFWVSRADAAALQSAALTTPQFQVTLACDNPWQTHPASNLIGRIEGTDPVLKKQVVVIESYYDSMSVVPTLAPGAEQAGGIASLLELARAYKADPPKRTVWFVACGAHFLGMQGARTYVDQHLEEWQEPSGWERFKSKIFGTRVPQRDEVLLFSGLDLSSQTGGVGVFYKGVFYDYREDVQGDFADIGRACRENAAKIGQVLGFDPTVAFADGINQINGKGWRNYLPGQFAFDAEVATLAGGKGITFASTDDSRQRCDTPADTADNVNVANLARQTRLLACEYWHLLNDTNDPNAVAPKSAIGVMPVPDWPAWTRQGLRLGMTRLTGSTLLFDPKQNFVPDIPVPDSLAVVANPSKTMVGVRGNLIEGTYTPPGSNKPQARFDFVGMPIVISNGSGLRFGAGGPIHLASYHIHAQDTPAGADPNFPAGASRGDIDFAPDQGVNGSANYPTEFDLTSDVKNTQVIVFPCVPTSIFDLIDQEALRSLTGVTVLDGATDGQPRQYGFVLAGNEPGVSYVEDVAVLFSAPGENTRLKVLMDSGPAATRFLLINSKNWDDVKDLAPGQRPCTSAQTCAQGIGYPVGVPSDVVVNGAITNTALRVAQDMWNLDDFRIRQLAKYRILQLHNADDPITGLHDIANDYIQKAQAALQSKDYDAFDAFSRQAWAYEARVYPQAQATANDVVKGVIFYLFLLIPFAYFMERLLFSRPNLKGQVGYAGVIFLLIFLLFSQIHPAFDITINPIIVLIAFVMLALSVIVSLLVWGKFEEQLQAFNRTVSGVHKADVGKASIAFAAFALGISNMRRRKERTLLTCITLVLLTFTVLSFTSIVNYTRINDVTAPGKPAYQGILLRTASWDALQEPAYRLLNDEYGRRYPVAPRSWFFGVAAGQQTFLRLTRANSGTDLKGVVGFSPAEADVTHTDKALTAGRWFNPTDSYSAIIPQGIADTLGITAADVGKVTVNFSGVPYLVIGILDPDKFKAIKDLDNETMTPADFQATQQQGNASSAAAAQQGFQEYQHLDPNNVLFVPYSTLINMGGDVRSVAVNFGDTATTASELKRLMPRLDLNIYAGEGGENHRFSSIGASQTQGLLTIIIPLLIAGLIVLNTMLGSVFERVKEIAIFSSIGLSPTNVAMLFIAEALVYGIIGAVSGYLIGQGLAKIISVTGILPGLYLNFSSTSAELAIGLVVAVVLLSTIFPARKASQVATPSVDRTWKVPDPDGDVWHISLPFAVTGAQAQGINGFLAEWFRSYEEQSVGDFLTQGIRTGTRVMENGVGFVLTGRVWLAPFDLGVSQDMVLETVPTDLQDVYEVHLTLTRLSGDVSNWKRVNRRFLNVVRKQFLIWRTLSAEQRERYLAMMAEPQEGAVDPVPPTPPSAVATVAPAL
ncbi:MAG: M28 family peptidase [Armatimonadetes bacterium]|nr:M28 family peptidase [Armatimonadota bacterium]